MGGTITTSALKFEDHYVGEISSKKEDFELRPGIMCFTGTGVSFTMPNQGI